MPKAKTKPKAKSGEASLRTTRAEAKHQSILKIPKLPNEVMHSILEMLKAEGDFKTLTSVARVSRLMYDIVIPKIYETVVFNEKNSGEGKRSKTGYGHGSKMDQSDLTRKDIATTFTRKLVFERVPGHDLSRHYPNVNEVTVGCWCLGSFFSFYDPLDHMRWMETKLNKCLEIVTSSHSLASTLHVNVRLGPTYDLDDIDLGTLMENIESAVPRTYEFFSDRQNDCYDHLLIAYELQAVYHPRVSSTLNASHCAESLAQLLQECLEEEDVEAPTGQIFLCDLPPSVLTPGQIACSSDPDEAALSMLCGLITKWPNLTGSRYKTKFDFFKSRVKSVKSGFRPALSDLYPKPQATRGLCAMLVEGQELVPDEEWSLTDEDPISSEAEYSGPETSDSGSESD